MIIDRYVHTLGTVVLSLEIQIWARKRFQGILKSPENAYRDQSPQGFDFITLYKFLRDAQEDYPDELQVLEAGGASIGIVSGQSILAKLTTMEDFENYQFDLQEE